MKQRIALFFLFAHIISLCACSGDYINESVSTLDNINVESEKHEKTPAQ